MSEGYVDRYKQEGLIRHAQRYYRGKIRPKLREAGYSTEILLRWEEGVRTTPSHFARICEVFGKSPDDFEQRGNDSARFYWLEKYLRLNDSNQRKAAAAGYLHTILWLHSLESPGSDVQLNYPVTSSNPSQEKVSLGYDLRLTFRLPNNRWAEIWAELNTDHIYLTLKSGLGPDEALRDAVSAFAGTCDCRILLRTLKILSRMGVDKSVPLDRITDEAWRPHMTRRD